jgi:hypothetical protein
MVGLVACQSAATPTSTLTATSKPTVVIRPTQTERPIPTLVSEATGGLPLSGFSLILSVIQEAEPEAYIETAPCTIYEESECVVKANFCPNEQECPHLLWLSNTYQSLMSLTNGDEDLAIEFRDDYASRFPHSSFENWFVFKLAEETMMERLTTNVLLSPEEQAELNELFDTPPERLAWRISAFPITDAIFEALKSELELEVVGPF